MKFFVESSKAMIAGDLSNFMSVRSRLVFLPENFTSKVIYFANSYKIFLKDKLARATL